MAVANAITTVTKDSMVADIIRMERTEEGKALRKDYEAGRLHHGFNEHREARLRPDQRSNTITTVQKDNLLCEENRGQTSLLTTHELSKSQTVLQQDTMEESQTFQHTIPTLLSQKATKFEKCQEFCSTLMARDYKGFGNQAMTEVIEYKKSK